MREGGWTGNNRRGNFSVGIPVVPLPPPFSSWEQLVPSQACAESLCTLLLAGCWGGGRADRNITHIFKAASPSPGPGFLLKAVLHSLETSWDVDRQ